MVAWTELMNVTNEKIGEIMEQSADLAFAGYGGDVWYVNITPGQQNPWEIDIEDGGLFGGCEDYTGYIDTAHRIGIFQLQGDCTPDYLEIESRTTHDAVSNALAAIKEKYPLVKMYLSGSIMHHTDFVLAPADQVLTAMNGFEVNYDGVRCESNELRDTIRALAAE